MLTLPPDEEPDWGYARNRQVLLKTPLAEWSASVLSASMGIKGREFWVPNRDFSWQGLVLGPLNGKAYKIVDGMGWERGEGESPLEVQYEPGLARYLYDSKEGGVTGVTLHLREEDGRAVLHFGSESTRLLLPLLDMTPTDSWAAGTYGIASSPKCMTVENSAIPFSLSVSGHASTIPVDQHLEWRYKLGDGFRRMRGSQLVFRDQIRSPYVPALLEPGRGGLSLSVQLPGNANRQEGGVLDLPDFGSGPVARAFRLRMSTLATYGLWSDGSWFPEAGSWWFRRPWLRDALEGIRFNLRTYCEYFDWRKRVRSLLVGLIAKAREAGGLPIILEEGVSFTSDAPPQLLGVAARLAGMSGDRKLLRLVAGLAEYAAGVFLAGGRFSDTVLKNEVLCSPANSSWIDSITQAGGLKWPSRLPLDWRGKVDPFESEFGLLEVNALYLEALNLVASLCETMGVEPPQASGVLGQRIEQGYTRLFAKSGLPPLTVAPGAGLLDDSAGSPSVVALAVLTPQLHGSDEARECWSDVYSRLLVHRRIESLGEGTHPFGVLVRGGPVEPYLGDEQYHGSTLWPRDTPYLVRLMDIVGESPVQLLTNNLDHMLVEGVVGYCNEIFSLPIGENPSPTPRSSNPVPVKNPAQYWSHWCDPYLEHAHDLGLKV